ncbi:hypothetical protein [Acidovorax sp. ST3]|uniref:hypothetical protein n=1 Tax=Acidovorax sp. ST3 TaxID=2219062 RepID=UPI001290281C|nr:hypothetical protein [Acidovorax sp. ST3]
MSSDRFQVQVEIEKIIGCPDPSQLALKRAYFKGEIGKISISDSQLSTLITAAKADASGTLFKALLSIVEGLEGLTRGGHSWAVVKLYYSVFYLLRSRMMAMGHIFFKCTGTIYSVELKKSAVPIERSKGKFSGSDVRGDHKTILATYIAHLGTHDILLTNKIGAESVFEWMMNAREDVHYRKPAFSEPELGLFYEDLITADGLALWIKRYLSDPQQIHCFLAEHCCLATPLVLARATLNDHLTQFTDPPLTVDQGQHLNAKLAGIFQNETELHTLIKSATMTAAA